VFPTPYSSPSDAEPGANADEGSRAPLAFAPSQVLVDHRPDGSTVVRSTEALRVAPSTLFAWLDRWAAERPDRAFVTEPRPEGQRTALTYAEAAAAVGQLATVLDARGIGHGDRVMITAPNSIEHLLWALAAMRCGAIYVPIAPHYVGPARDRAKLEGLLVRLQPRLVVCADREQLSRLPAGWQASTLQDLGESTGAGGSLGPPPVAGDVAKILLTSGSTGAPKAVPYSHGQMTAAMVMTTQVWTFVEDDPPVVLDWLPWNHAFGGTANLHLVLCAGGSLHIDHSIPSAATMGRTLAQVELLRPNIFFAVPATLDLLNDHLAADREAARSFFGSVRAIFSAGAALSPPTFESLRALSREAGSEVTLLSGWGGTETGPGATLVHRLDAQPGWVGGPLPGVELKLLPQDGKQHIGVRGPNVFAGYWDDPEATDAAFDSEGFYATGDAGRLVDPVRPELGLVFDGRLGDDFKLANGTWINYAGVRERLLTTLGGAAADVVVGIPDAPRLVALVWVREGATLDEDALASVLSRYNRESARPSDRLLALRPLASPPTEEELSPKGQLRARQVRELRRAEFQDLLCEKPREVSRN